MPLQTKPKYVPVKIALAYLVLSAFWIYFSDMAATRMAATPEELQALQSGKGFLFIIISALLLYAVTRSYLESFLRTQRIAVESEHRLSLALSNLNEHCFLMCSNEGVLTWWNEGAKRMLGYEENEVKGKPLSQFFAEPLPKPLKEILQESVTGTGCEHTLTRKNGQQFPARCTLSPLMIEGHLEGFSLVIHDLTQQNQSKEKEKRLFRLLDNAKEAIALCTEDGTIQYINKGGCALCDQPGEQLYGKKLRELVTELPQEIMFLLQGLNTIGSWQGEVHVKLGTKALVLDVSVSKVFEASGKPSLLIFASNITDHKQLEAKFLRAQRLESIGVLTSGIAHDLRNVLAPISLSSYLIEPGITEEDATRIRETLSSCVKRAIGVTKQLLAFGRGNEETLVVLQPRHLLCDILKVLRETLPPNITIKESYASGLATILGDPTQFQQIFLNLCVNASDAMPSGGTLSVCAANVTVCQTDVPRLDIPAGDYVRITVSDTGSGIPPEIVDKIFEPFFTTKPVGEGTGLGLSTTRSLVNRHKGFLQLTSTVGQGTVFTIYFPAHGDEELTDAVEKEIPLGEGEEILLIEDEHLLAESVRKTLLFYGYKPTTACNGAEALVLCRQNPKRFAFLLLDLLMPVMDGVQFLKAYAQIPGQSTIIVCTGANLGHKGVPSYQELLTMGVSAILPKPYSSAALLQALHQSKKYPHDTHY